MRRLPRELADEARGIVDTHATAAAGLVRANYAAHSHTGDLAAGVQTRTGQAGAFGAAAIVASTAKQAHWFESGTAARHTGAGSYRGVMKPAPPLHAFVPVIVAERRRMYDDLRALLTRAGLEVRGDVD